MSNRKILIVDDEEVILNLFEQVFKRGGYTVRTAGSGVEALEILRHENILVMFLDLNMPDMNGIDLCKEIRKDFPTAIINAVTGYSSNFQLEDCRDAGFDDYLTKPASVNILLQAAKNAFEKVGRWESVSTQP